MLHLVHPALVHFAVALLVLGPVVEAWGLLARRESAARFGGILTIAGSVALVPTIVTGYLAANSVTVEGDAATLLGRHENLALTLLAACLVLALARAWNRGRIEGGARIPFAAGLLTATLIAAATAYVGGRLVYVFAVGVAR